MSFPLWERGLKSPNSNSPAACNPVVPLVGTWIEIYHKLLFIDFINVDHHVGTWIEMGYGGCTNIILCVVVPLVGTWIEIQSQMLGRRSQRVVPLVGTWIEIFIPRHIYNINMSFP